MKKCNKLFRFTTNFLLLIPHPLLYICVNYRLCKFIKLNDVVVADVVVDIESSPQYVKLPIFLISSSSPDLSDFNRKLAQIQARISEDKDAFQSFQLRSDGDIKSLKNLTLNVLYSMKNSKLDNFLSCSCFLIKRAQVQDKQHCRIWTGWSPVRAPLSTKEKEI